MRSLTVLLTRTRRESDANKAGIFTVTRLKVFASTKISHLAPGVSGATSRSSRRHHHHPCHPHRLSKDITGENQPSAFPVAHEGTVVGQKAHSVLVDLESRS